MSITKATIADAEELTRLINSAYRGESSRKGWATEAHLLDGIRIDEPTMVDYLTHPDTSILKYTNGAGKIISCVYLELKEKGLYLGMLTVAPDRQANGIGRQMLHEAEILAHNNNCGIIYMTVISSRHELIRWYERRGYRATGEMVPFPTDNKFGVPKEPIELAVYEKEI